MALSTQIVDFVGQHDCHQIVDGFRLCQVETVQSKSAGSVRAVRDKLCQTARGHRSRVPRRRVNFVPFPEQKLAQITAVLSGGSRHERPLAARIDELRGGYLFS